MALVPALYRDMFMDMMPFTAGAPFRNTGSKVITTKDHHKILVDVHEFKPEEICIKTMGRDIVVEGKHDEKVDEHGYISRHIVRKYHLPEGHRPEEVHSTLSSDGILSIVAPRHVSLEDGHRKVPITFLGSHRHEINGHK